jgi:hypothetical protein
MRPTIPACPRPILYAMLALVTGCEDCTVTSVDICVDHDDDGLCGAEDACEFHAEVPVDGPAVRGSVACMSPDNGTSDPLPLAYLPVHSRFGEATTDCNGEFVIPVADAAALTDGPVDVGFYYDNELIGPSDAVTRLRVMDDLEVAWGAGAFHFGFFQTVDGDRDEPADSPPVLELDQVVIATSECEVWRVGTAIVDDFHEVRRAPVPGGFLQFMRRSGVFGTSPYAFYDHVDLASDILDLRPGRDWREQTLFHETGHVIRDVTDGDEAHWHGDNVNYRYARCHMGTEIFEEPYAFHEGWAQYWEQARRAGRARLTTPGATTTAYCDGEAGPRGLLLTRAHTDWVENMIADHLLDLAECVGDGDDDRGDRIMVETLEDTRGLVHSVQEFQQALCGAHDCCALELPAPDKCPPEYNDDGASCRGPDGHVIRHYRG